jgi:cell division septum initiation protein DivIVA
MASRPDRPDPSSPTAVAQAEFATVRKGFAPDEVRTFLIAVGAELERAAARLMAVEAELEQARRERLDLGTIDDETLSRMVGEETAAVLRAAREGAAQLRARAEQAATEMLDAAAAEADRVRQSAAEEAARLRTGSAEVAEREIADAKAEGRQMIEEAARHRERLDLAVERHRESARLWAAEVEAEQRRLAEQFVRVRAMADEAVARLGPPPSAATVDADAAAAGDPADETTDSDAVAGESAVTLFDAEEHEDEAEEDAPEPVEADDADVDSTANVVRLFAVPSMTDDVAGDDVATGDDVTDDDVTGDVVGEEGAVEPDEPAGSTPDGERDSGDVDTATSIDGETIVVESARDTALGRIPAAATRTAKRVLADEQNAVLETLSGPRAVTDLGDVLPGVDEHAAMYVAAVVADLEAAVAVGAGAGVAAAVPDGARVAIVDMVGALRERVEQVIADGAGDNQVIAKRLRAVYRDVKSTVVEVAITDAVLHAHAAGQLAGAADGAAFRWVAEAGARPCPDCEDNSLAGPTPAGEPFPAGHVAPPAHPGCRCELVPDHG